MALLLLSSTLCLHFQSNKYLDSNLLFLSTLFAHVLCILLIYSWLFSIASRKKNGHYSFVEHLVYSNFKVDRIMNLVSWLILLILLILKINLNLAISALIPCKNITCSWNSGYSAKKAVIRLPLSIWISSCICHFQNA